MRLLDPLPLGPRTAPNRLMFGPHVTNLGHGRAPSERHVAYYARRAAGGAGVLVTEIASVHESDWPYERSPLAAACGPGWAAIGAACRPYGSLVLAGIGHAGGQGSSAYSQAPLWAPSGVPEVNTREMPKVMEAEDIAAVVAGFSAAASVAASAGLDGVEVNGGQFSLVRQFCSGLTNQRSDSYGADRLLFAREVLSAVRDGLGSDRVLGLRVCADELAPWAGVTPEAAVPLVAELAGYVDYVVVERGSIYSVAATRPDLHTEPGFNLEVTREIRAALASGAVPVFVQGSIVDPAMAEAAIADGTADGVEMTRAQIADADLGRKLAGGRAADVRPCVLCNQRCQVRDNRNPIVTCIGDPRSGHETEDTDPETSSVREGRDVLVVGGGPAGLEAARVAAIGGHRVRLVESGTRIGGRLRAAAAAPALSRLAGLADWLEAQCRALGVKLEPGHALSPDEAAEHEGPVIVCTGSVDRPYEYETGDPSRVTTADRFLSGSGAESGAGAPIDVAVWDPIGGPIGVAIAEMLAARDDAGTVSLIFPDQIPGQNLALSGDLAPANTRLQSAGVRLERRATLRRVTADGAEIEDHFGAGTRTVPADLVIDAGHRLPDDTLPGFHRAGDAVAPRTVHEAVLDGRRAALALGEDA